ncbi:putative Pterin 4 alpha carbinolamine dehydratase [Trypanosoma vivax]|uniref:4a-hydroxytetrahydrobiopterin dehydratase n=1 Tax=Trypanosoma vivax (strain Y486) TaxID=1055687 RepID=G0UBQ2_TRYVY|nr:putative pterin-4-alpha-carbinolamine dehydratase [Trypanosoma vivax]KAH8609430.1 putative Pterin 4 alpha carbinolamine dehydratase [Trypanosoma vivax]CCC53250.1 putative pterin-4-alpha-carbinolamine dehydratase [Trypanosoma vivax Y486]
MHRTLLALTRQTPLSFPAITRALQDTPGWRLDGNNNGIIHREFGFRDAGQVSAFITAIAADSEKAGHHPSFSTKPNAVHVKLTTHDAGDQVTQKDIEMARRLNAAFGQITG